MAVSLSGVTLDLMERVSMKFMFLHLASFSCMSVPLLGTHEPFSMRAMVRFWILWATRSSSRDSMVTKMPLL